MFRVYFKEFSSATQLAIDAVYRVNFYDTVFFSQFFHFAVLSKAEVAINHHYFAGESLEGCFEDFSKVFFHLFVVDMEIFADENKLRIKATFSD